MRLKREEIKAYRAKQLKNQDGMCPMCEQGIPDGQDTLDHDHGDGHVRLVLCRNCNSIEGRILAWVKRTKTDPDTWLTNLMSYWHQDYTANPLHPSHRSEIQKEISRKRKRMKQVKREKTKKKIQAEINRLKKLLVKENKDEY